MTAPQQQKLRVKGPVVITANRLADGAVVYRTPDGGWTTDLAAAFVTTQAGEAAAALRAASASDLEAVGPYVAPVILDESIRPGNLRERIRREGPTFPLPGSQAA